MKSDVKALWVEALRSGKYEQTTGALKCESGHCCLGVLTELHAQHAEDKMQWVPGDEDALHYPANSGSMGYGRKGTFAYPPKRVLAWAGLHHTTAKNLASKNDDLGHSFHRLADYIENNL